MQDPAKSVNAARGHTLRQGALVHHAKFGEGKVLDASGSGPDRRVTVLFRTAGRKRLVAQYAQLEIVG